MNNCTPEKKPIIRIPFEERMVKADKEMKDNYNEIKNEILSYGCFIYNVSYYIGWNIILLKIPRIFLVLFF